jgi:hypothetical protein
MHGDLRHRRQHRGASTARAGEGEHRYRRVDHPVDVVVDQSGDALEIAASVGAVKLPYVGADVAVGHRILPAPTSMSLPLRRAKHCVFRISKITPSAYKFAAIGPESAWDWSAAYDARGSNRRTERANSRATTMQQQDNGTFGIIVGGIFALAAVFFIFGGGEFGGKKTVEGDQDLPPIATADQ